MPTGYLDFRTGVKKSLPTTTATPAQIRAVAGGAGLVRMSMMCDGVQSVSANTTLTDGCSFVEVTGTGDITITLPASNARGTAVTQKLTIKNMKSSGTLTLQRAGSDDLYLYGGTTAQTNTTIPTGAMMQLMSNGNNAWYVLI
jgi:hypothetical protein